MKRIQRCIKSDLCSS